MQRIEIFLKEKVLDKLDFDPHLLTNVSKWFKDMSSPSDTNGNRFLICAAIDIKYELFDTNSLINILKTMNFVDDSKKNLFEFNKVCKNCFVYSSFSDKEFTKEKYSAVMPWGRLFEKLQKYLSEEGVSIPDLNDSDAYYNIFFFQNNKSDLKFVKEWNNKSKGIVWVLPHSHLLELIKNSKGDINFVLDGLGIYYSKLLGGKRDNVIYIEYPDDFSEQSFQPCTTSENWSNSDGLYLSYKKDDGYGRTRSTSGNLSIITKERVHKSENYGSDKFIVNELGIYKGALILNRNQLINDGLNRF